MNIIKCPWDKKFISMIKKAKKEIIIVTPYISKYGTDLLKTNLKNKSGLAVKIITNLRPSNTFGGGTDLKAIQEIYECLKNLEVRSLSNLHAKIYMIDNEIVLISSGNLTKGGLINNYEYGILFEDNAKASQIRRDVQYILEQSAHVSKTDISDLAKLADDAVKQTEVNMTKLKKYKRILEKYKNKQIELKIKSSGEKTVHAVFKESISVLLKEHGNLTTREMHPRIQQMHPEMCDDSVDRVIEGKHFGKKWKHEVRGAQVGLKRKGLIELKNGKWYLT